jgi:hypothetical protein
MVKQRIRFLGYVSDKTTVAASSSKTITYTINDDSVDEGGLKLEEIAIAYDSILQAGGRFTLRVGGKTITSAISSLSTNAGFGFSNLHTIVYKGTTIEVDIYNTDASNSGTAQLLVSIYEEKEMPNSIEKLQMELLKKQMGG